MLFSLFTVIFWIQLISGWDYKVVTKYPITPVTYSCPVPLNINKKPLLLNFYYPDRASSNLIKAFAQNINLQDPSDDVFSKSVGIYTYYPNIPDTNLRDPSALIKFNGYVTPPYTIDELHKYEFKYSSLFLEEYYREYKKFFLSRKYSNYIRVRVDVANRLPLLRTENYCTGWKFFSCFYLRENFWYEGELQYYLQDFFRNHLYVIIASDRVYFSWLQFMRKMQIRAGVVLRMSKIAHRPVPYIIEAIKKLSCHWNQEKPNGENSIYYSLSMEMLLSQTDLNIAKNSPGFPYIIVAVPTHLAKDSMTIARMFFEEETIAELIGFFSAVFKLVRIDVVFVDTKSQAHKLFEAYDTLTKSDNLSYIVSEIKQYFLATVKDTENTFNVFNLKADIFTKIIRERTELRGSHVLAPIVITFSEIPNLFKNEYDSFDDKKHVLSFIRELKQRNAHALFINSVTTHYQSKMPIKDTDVDVSVIPVNFHPLHLIHDVFLITRDHVIDRISQVMRVDKQQLTFDTEFTATLPKTGLTAFFLDVVALVPTKSSSSDVALSKTYFAENNLSVVHQFLQRFLRPLQLRIGQADFNSDKGKEGIVDCSVRRNLAHYESIIAPTTIEDQQVGEAPIKHLDFERCLSKFFWLSSSYKVAVIFVDTMTKDWVDAASEATVAFATQGRRKKGMIIFVSANIPAELREHREKDVYTIDSAVCSDIKQCVLDRIYYSKLINGQKRI